MLLFLDVHWCSHPCRLHRITVPARLIFSQASPRDLSEQEDMLMAVEVQWC